MPKAKLIAQLFEPLDEREAARAEALILDELAGKTYPQVERLAWRAALAVAPDIAERSRTAAEKHARVTVFREDSGAVGLSGRDLPAAEALSAHANVVARAREYQASGAFDGQAAGRLEALAYTDLLNGVSVRERVAFAAAPARHRPEALALMTVKATARPSDGDGGPNEPGSSGEENGPDDPQAPPLAEVTVPLATLQHRAERAGDNRRLGPLDPALARDLAAAAARSPNSRWEIIAVDEHGYAIAHGIARPPAAEDPRQRSRNPIRARRAPAAPGAWQFTPRKPGTWALTLPGGQQLAVGFDAVPTYSCDHRYAVSSYLPGDRLRRLVQVRDHECTWPPCSRPARDSDFEHAVPYDKGGITDACNAGARSRRCHQVKQMPGWILTQPKPGWHVWTTPTGSTTTGRSSTRAYSRAPGRPPTGASRI